MGDILNQLPAIPGIPEDLESVIGSFSFEKIWSQFTAYIMGYVEMAKGMIPAPVVEFYNTHTVVFLLALVCALALVAFEGYRFFRMLTYAGSAFLFGVVGYWYISPMLESTVKPMLPENIDYHALVGVACAAVAILLCQYAFNFTLLLLGGGVGYVIGTTVLYGFLVDYFNSLTFLQDEKVKMIIGGVAAVFVAILFSLMFKLLFMLATSFGGSIAAALILKNMLVPTGDDNVKICFMAIGVAVAIFAMVRQRKQEENTVFSL